MDNRLVLRSSLFVLAGLAVAGALLLVWTSSPNVPLTLTRREAIERASVDATVGGRVMWTRVESKLATYREWTRLLHMPPTGDEDPLNPDALFWVVAYVGLLATVDTPAYRCEWVIRVFAADGRTPATYGASTCGQGGWQWPFALLPDRAWWRLSPGGA